MNTDIRQWWLLVLLLTSCWSALSMADDNDDWVLGSQYQRLFDARTMKTVQGRVLRIEPFCPGSGRFSGIQLVLELDRKQLAVHLGPQWYVEDQSLPLAYNDVVKASGSMVTFAGAPAMMATEISTAEGSMLLRNADGTAFWLKMNPGQQ